MTRRRRTDLGCVLAGLLAAWALDPPADRRFVGRWKVADLPVGSSVFKESGLLETDVVKAGTRIAPDGSGSL